MGSQALAPPQVVDVTLALFGGRKTDIAPSDCPEGVTPDEQDGAYLPGDWQSRPCLKRLYPQAALTTDSEVLYEKTYIQPNNEPLTLLLTADGKLWMEDVANSPDEVSSIFQVAPGLSAQSVTAFGREYIAFSDLLHGQGVPLQYNGQWLDRVTQDGPGAGPTVTNYQPASATIEGTATTAVPISASPIGIVWGGATNVGKPPGVVVAYTYFTVKTIAVHGLKVGQRVTLAGTTSTPAVNNSYIVATVPSATTFTVNQLAIVTLAANGGGGTATPNGASLARVQGVVTAETETAHGFQAGWQVQVSGISNVDLGGGIASITRDGNGVVTVTTEAAHGIPAQAYVCIVGVTDPDASFNIASVQVTSVPSPTTFTYQQGGTVEASASGTGNVQDIFNTTAFIQSVPSATSFTYQQVGPDDSSNDTGTATIIGQISPGVHGFVVIFLTRNGDLTSPSPPVFLTANGGSQAAFSNLPIGPPNVVGRLIGATGAGGDNYFTIPATPQVGPQIVGASFLIPDNTTTAAIIDFNDNTLFDAIAIDQIGNDLFDQRVIGPVLGFFAYASRLMCWGDYQKIENLLNMGFCGGTIGGDMTTPLGWTKVTAGGLLVQGGPWGDGMVYQSTGDGTANLISEISQPAAEDAYGTAILLPNTQYEFRVWGQNKSGATVGYVQCTISSASLGFNAFARIPVSQFSAIGNFAIASISDIVFIDGVPTQVPVKTPSVIPGDMIISTYTVGTGAGVIIARGEQELVYSDNPYNNVLIHASYVDNPGAFAQTTGDFGAADDDSAVQCLALLHESSLLETADGVHLFQDTNSEPYQWQVNQRTRAVGALGLRAGDPGKFGTGDAAEDWALVASKNGVYLFAGGEFWKVSQEISRGALPQSQDSRPTWDDINWAAQQSVVAKNDPAKRRAYFSVPILNAIPGAGGWVYSPGAAPAQPNCVFVLDYREMDTATQIASAPPVHITIQGKMKSSDLTRKWSVWNVSANDIEILVRPGNVRDLFFAGGERGGEAYGNIYSLDPGLLTDDDYGQIFPYYTTYAFTDHDQEQALGLGSDSHLYKHIHAFIAGVGQVIITPIRNSIYNFQPALSPRSLTPDTNAGNFLANDLEWSGTMIRGQRIFFRISVQPFPGATDVQVRVNKFIVAMMKDPILQFRQSGV